jgi:hypothetical protein
MGRGLLRFPACHSLSSRFHGGRKTLVEVQPPMAGPLVLVVRETPSLADSLQLLLETVGFRVRTESGIPSPFSAPDRTDAEPARAIVLACNRPRSEVLRGFPDRFPAEDRDLPVVVVGDRAAEARGAWPPNVHFVSLPFDARSFVKLLTDLTAPDLAPPREPVAIEH